MRRARADRKSTRELLGEIGIAAQGPRSPSRSESVDMPARHACALYLSSSAKSIAQAVALRASKVAGASVVDVFVDPDYARSSVKLVAERAPLPR